MDAFADGFDVLTIHTNVSMTIVRLEVCICPFFAEFKRDSSVPLHDRHPCITLQCYHGS